MKPLKTSKVFQTLRKEECAGEAYKIILNAKAIWRDAGHLESFGSYARALALEIYALEELTKAFVLLLDSRGFNLRKLNNLKVLNKDHQQRHVVIMIAAVFDVLGKEMQKGVNWIKDDTVLYERLVEQEEQVISELTIWMAKYYTESLGPSMMQLAQWAAILGDTRSDGIYTEYRDELHTPLQLDMEAYLTKSERIESAYHALRSACVWLRRGGPSLDKVIAPIRERLKTPEQYSALDEFFGEHLKDRAVFEKIAGTIAKTMKHVEHAFIRENANTPA
ncbi:MAG: AbiV family abortive infection protein [Flavobacteriales bacterium]|nr:AbiV family abortive infection protein [Flavobacteriales bacterium]MBP6696543.1 AbiV family abortive infection protein [Flavobacteriales bacterium]